MLPEGDKTCLINVFQTQTSVFTLETNVQVDEW